MKFAKADSLTIFLTPCEIRNDQPIGFWFCLRAQPKREHIAAACLRQIPGVEVSVLESISESIQIADPSGSSNPCFPGTSSLDLVMPP